MTGRPRPGHKRPSAERTRKERSQARKLSFLRGNIPKIRLFQGNEKGGALLPPRIDSDPPVVTMPRPSYGKR